MPEPVREIGRVEDMGGGYVVVGVDGLLGAVTLGRIGGDGTVCCLNADQRKGFALLFHEAERQAEASDE